MPQPSNIAKFWRKISDKKIECELCPKRCVLEEDQSGECQFRRFDGKDLIAMTYGLSSGFFIDPIEKKQLFHFFPGTPVMSFGTAGCNLKCKFCQDYLLSHCGVKNAELTLAPPEKIVKAAKSLNCHALAFTRNEPIIFHEFAVATARLARLEGIKTVAITNGYVLPKPREEFYKEMDAALVSLKGFSEEFYKDYIGGELKPVLETLEYVKKKTSTWLEITTPLIPGVNDNENEIRQMAEWIAQNLSPDTPLHLSAFLPSNEMRYYASTRPADIVKARKWALKSGLRYVYTSNIHDPKTQNTFCHYCGREIICRKEFRITDWHLKKDGGCEYCGTHLTGVFEAEHGLWGSKHLQIQLALDRDLTPRILNQYNGPYWPS